MRQNPVGRENTWIWVLVLGITQEDEVTGGKERKRGKQKSGTGKEQKGASCKTSKTL